MIEENLEIPEDSFKKDFDDFDIEKDEPEDFWFPYFE